MILPQHLFDQIVKHCEENELGAVCIGKENTFDAIIIGRKDGPSLESTLIFLAHLILAGIVEGRFSEDHPDTEVVESLASMEIEENTKKH